MDWLRRRMKQTGVVVAPEITSAKGLMCRERAPALAFNHGVTGLQLNQRLLWVGSGCSSRGKADVRPVLRAERNQRRFRLVAFWGRPSRWIRPQQPQFYETGRRRATARPLGCNVSKPVKSKAASQRRPFKECADCLDEPSQNSSSEFPANRSSNRCTTVAGLPPNGLAVTAPWSSQSSLSAS